MGWRRWVRGAACWLGVLGLGCAEPAGELAASGGTGGSSGPPAAGASGEDVRGGTAADVPAADEVAERLAQSYCAALATCCQTSSLPTDRAACQRAFLDVTDPHLVPAPGLVYDPDAALRCEAALVAFASCSAPIPGIEDDCARVFSGERALGEPCTEDRDCAGQPNDAECGTVADLGRVCIDTSSSGSTHAALGEPCAGTCTDYGDGSVGCGMTVTGSTPVPEGAGNCYTNDGLRCGAGRVCEPLAALGERCTTASDCTPEGTCTDGECVPRSELGEPCDDPWWVCAAGLRCVGGACGAPLEEGEACVGDEDCAAGLECVMVDDVTGESRCLFGEPLRVDVDTCTISFGLED